LFVAKEAQGWSESSLFNARGAMEFQQASQHTEYRCEGNGGLTKHNVVADERDMIGVHSTYRQPQQDVYVYRVRDSVQSLRRVFLDYKIDQRSARTARLLQYAHAQLHDEHSFSYAYESRVSPVPWKVLLSGYVPDYLYQLDRIDTTRPFAELEKLSHVNRRAHEAGKDPAFSQRIREGLPLPVP
jgi:hypothetical protein